MNLLEILKNLKNNRNELNEHLNNFNGIFKHTAEIIEQLEKSIVDRDASQMEYLLFIGEKDGLDKSYTPIFCKLLMETWHDRHEVIISFFEMIKDHKSVDCIYSTCLMLLPEDEGRSLQKKSIWALGAIRNSVAIDRLKTLSQSDEPITREYAAQQLIDVKYP